MSYKKLIGAILVFAFTNVFEVVEIQAQSTDSTAEVAGSDAADSEVKPGNREAIKKRRQRRRRAAHKSARGECLEEDSSLKGEELRDCVKDTLKTKKEEKKKARQ